MQDEEYAAEIVPADLLIAAALERLAASAELVAPMVRWFFENADLIFKPKEN